MPRLKLDYEETPYRRCGQQSGNGLRSNRYTYVEDETPRSQREKDDRFDMYRNDQPPVRRMPAPKIKKNTTHEPRQLWYVACLICALGAFCLFADSVMITVMGVPLRMTSAEIILGSDTLYGYSTRPMICLSATPLIFVGMFAVFAFLKERTFEKASLVMIALSVLAVVLQIYFADKMMRMNMNGIEFTPDTGFLIQIACSVGLIIVVVCQKVMCSVNARKVSW